MTTEKSCQTCRHKEVCIKFGLAVFLLFIQPRRYDEVEDAIKGIDISAGCAEWEASDEHGNQQH